MPDLTTLTRFFMWCTIINGGILLFWIFFCLRFPDLVYRTQSWVFPLPRTLFDPMIYAFMGLFKLFFILFNLVPYLALTLIA